MAVLAAPSVFNMRAPNSVLGKKNAAAARIAKTINMARMCLTLFIRLKYNYIGVVCL